MKTPLNLGFLSLNESGQDNISAGLDEENNSNSCYSECDCWCDWNDFSQ